MKPDWIEYTGDERQIAEMQNAKDGFIAKNCTSVSSVLLVKYNQLFILGQKMPHLPELFGNALSKFLVHNNTTHYLICQPHPNAGMAYQQMRTGQPVYVNTESVKVPIFIKPGDSVLIRHDKNGFAKEIGFVTNTPYWHIPGAEYRLTPFED